MKRYFTILAMALPLAVAAQNVWEKPEETTSVKKEVVKEETEVMSNPDEKYLRGAVPEVDGKVCWTLDVDVPGKSATEIYDIMYKALDELTKGADELEGSAIVLINKQEHIIVANVHEWLLFKQNLLSLDRTKMKFTLIAKCSDGHMSMTLSRISYIYEEERNKQVYTAEEWITDDNAVNKKNTKLFKGSAKFRRKTIDRKDEIFNTIKDILNK